MSKLDLQPPDVIENDELLARPPTLTHGTDIEIHHLDGSMTSGRFVGANSFGLTVRTESAVAFVPWTQVHLLCWQPQCMQPGKI